MLKPYAVSEMAAVRFSQSGSMIRMSWNRFAENAAM